jgi:hypothetical protein
MAFIKVSTSVWNITSSAAFCAAFGVMVFEITGRLGVKGLCTVAWGSLFIDGLREASST